MVKAQKVKGVTKVKQQIAQDQAPSVHTRLGFWPHIVFNAARGRGIRQRVRVPCNVMLRRRHALAG